MDDRMTAKEALKHPYFRDLYEADKKSMYINNFPLDDRGASNLGPRGTSQYTNSQRSLKLDSEMNSDAQSATGDMNNLSQFSSNQHNNININISTHPQIQNTSNININVGRKENGGKNVKPLQFA